MQLPLLDPRRKSLRIVDPTKGTIKHAWEAKPHETASSVAIANEIYLGLSSGKIIKISREEQVIDRIGAGPMGHAGVRVLKVGNAVYDSSPLGIHNTVTGECLVGGNNYIAGHNDHLYHVPLDEDWYQQRRESRHALVDTAADRVAMRNMFGYEQGHAYYLASGKAYVFNGQRIIIIDIASGGIEKIVHRYSKPQPFTHEARVYDVSTDHQGRYQLLPSDTANHREALFRSIHPFSGASCEGDIYLAIYYGSHTNVVKASASNNVLAQPHGEWKLT